MHTELLLLSGQIALLVLLASALAFGIAWWMRGQGGQTLQEEQAKRQAIEQQLAETQTTLSNTEQQCIAALEQRDNAEQQAAQHTTEARKLQDTIRNLECDALLDRANHKQELEAARSQAAELVEAKVREATDNAEQARAELQSLKETTIAKDEHESSINKLQLTITSLTEQQTKATNELERTQSELKKLQQETISKAAHETALRESTQAFESKLQSVSTELEAARKALQESKARITQLETQPPTPPAPAQLPKPLPVQPLPATPTPVVEEPELSFPPAPMLPTLKRKLFKGIDQTPQAPAPESLNAARELLTKLNTALAEQNQRILSLTDKKLSAATEERGRTLRHIDAVTRSLAFAQSANARTDDLTLIKGVKEVLNKQLQAHGIFSYRQIAEWTEDDIQSFGEMLSFKQRIHKDHWQDQARQLHEARYGEALK